VGRAVFTEPMVLVMDNLLILAVEEITHFMELAMGILAEL
jgi:hypothetical protein